MILVPGSCLAQVMNVTGVVRSTGDGRPIAGANVRFANESGSTANSVGQFRLSTAAPGIHQIIVRALGFRPRTIHLRVERDTSITITLEPYIGTLDTVRVLGRFVTVTGVVVDARTTLPVLRSQVTVIPGGATLGTASGRFSVRVPASELTMLSAEGLEYLPSDVTIDVTTDTSIVIALRTDSVALRRIGIQVARLKNRSHAMPYRIDALSRDDINRSAQLTVGHLILRRLPVRSVSSRWPYYSGKCVFLDDRKVSFEVLLGTASETVERVEVFGQEARMIRVYSRPYVADLERQDELRPIIFMGNGSREVCE